MTSMQTLTARLNEMCNELPFHTGWHLKDVSSGETSHLNGDVVVPSASTRKIAILIAALKAVNQGTLSLDQPFVVQSKYQNNDSGCFQHLTPGFAITLRDALVMMIIVSDNTCTGAVSDLVGLDNVNALCQSIGLKGTNHLVGLPPLGLGRNHSLDQVNTTTPNDVGLLLDLILQGSSDPTAADKLGCTTELCQLAIDILSWQKLRNKLPALLPLGTKVAHKTGTGYESRTINDAGIIYQGNEPLFILSAYTENVPVELPDGQAGHAAASALISRICRECYDVLKR